MSYRQREVVFEGPGDISIRPRELPSSPSPYNLIVRTRSSIMSSGTETAFLYHPPGSPASPRFPIRPGAGIVGEIVRVGDAVKGVRPELRLGQRVFVRQHHQAYAHCDALSDCIYPVPDDVTDEAMLLARQAIIGIHAVRTAGIGLGTSVHVIGLGVIGQLIARLAVIAGARPVSAVDHHRNRLAAVQRVAQVAPLAEDVKNEVDVVLVACGSPSAVTEGLEMTAVGGALLLVGGRAGMTSIDLTGRVFRRNVRIIGVHQTGAVGPNGDSAKWQSLLDLAVRLIRDGSLNIEGLITHHVAPSEIASSYELLLGDKGNRIGAIIDWTID